jgi:hypothetical protein
MSQSSCLPKAQLVGHLLADIIPGALGFNTGSKVCH